MNSPEDTKMLKTIDSETLRLARIWPSHMRLVAHAAGLISSCTGLAYLDSSWTIVGISSLVLVWSSYRLTQFNKDIVLIDNEMIRRTKE